MAETKVGNKSVSTSSAGKPRNGEIREKAVITLDKNLDEVLELDSKGCVLLFPADPAKFLLLKPEQYGKLSTENRQRYAYALEEWEYLRSSEAETAAAVSRFEVDQHRVAAGSRLAIDNPDPRFKYVWKAPENVREMLALGGEVVSATGKEQTMNSVAGHHVISNQGKDELVLCRIPKTTQAKLDEQGRKGLEALKDMGKREFGDLVRQAKAEVVEGD